MKLPFRYQFILAPMLVVVFLAALVAYTIVELANINAANEVTRQWVIMADRNQTAIAGVVRLQQVLHELTTPQALAQDENFFSYLEQSRILSDSLTDAYPLSQVAPQLRRQIARTEQLLREPEKVNTTLLLGALTDLLPALEQQQKLFSAQRRTSYIDFHRNLLVIIERLSIVLLSVLLLCIAMATGLGLWGLHVIRRRLQRLNENAQAACVGDRVPATLPGTPQDELDDLEICLANMTTRLLHVVSVANVLHGVEHERRRIAMDMHDGVLADLTAINRKLDILRNETSQHEAIGELRAEVDDVIGNLRRTIDDLHPQVLETLGLEPALRSLLERCNTVAGFPQYHFEFEQNIENAIPLHYKLNLFRIIAEAINNVVKHAHCNRLEIGLRLVTQQLMVSVADNGVGIGKSAQSTGHGCANMAERARLIGATVQWRAARFASGTCVELTLPLPLPG